MLRVRVAMTGMAGAPYVATHWFGGTGATAAQAAADAAGLFWGTIDNSLPNSLSWGVEPTVAEVDAVTGQTTAVNAVTPTTGQGAVNAVLHSPAEQGLVQWHTGAYINGRELRGRTFIPGMSNSTSNSNGTPTTTFINLVTGAATAMIAGSGSDVVVWSRAHGQALSALSASMWSQFAVLRSRRD